MKNIFSVAVGSLLILSPLTAIGELSDWDTLIDVRYRLERVDADGFDNNATASTLRLRLGITSPEWSGFRFGLVGHGNRHIGSERFNSTANGEITYPVVADPDDEGISAAWVGYRAGELLDLKIGRQRIIEDNHRFIGNVGLRQLVQTFDAVTLAVSPADNWRIDARYLDKAHRVFGRSNPNVLLAEADLDAWMVTVGYRFERMTLAGFAHRLVFEDRPASHRNLGVRMSGDLSSEAGLGYRVEFARQSGLKESSASSDRDYLYLRINQRLEQWHWFAGHERLEGDGNHAFQTPLATLHAHNGWTDQFLTTPADGLIDTHLAAGTSLGHWRGLVKLHDFRRDRGSNRYGNEYGLMIGRKLPAGLDVEFKFAYLDGKRNQPDVSKLWLTLTGSW
jgi:hypothetical protein